MHKKILIAFIFLLSPVLVSAASLTDGLVGYWTFNGSDINGTTAYDKSGQGNNGTLTNGPTKVAGKLGQALDFSGVKYTTQSISNFRSSDNEGAISAWIKGVPGISSIIFSSDNSTSNQSRFIFYTSDANDPKARLRFLTTVGGVTNTVEGSSSVLDNKWHHVVAISNGSVWTMYVDGVSQTVTATNGTNVGNWFSDVSGRDRVTIGAQYNGATPAYSFKGIIDDVRIYNRVLSASEVAALYKLGLATAAPANNTGLVGYWSLDNSDINGTTAYDRSGKGNNGTLTNSPTKVAGKLGQGLSLIDTLSKYIEIPDTSALRLTGGGTITAWIKPNSLNAIAATIVDKGTTNTSTTDGYRFNITTSGQIGIRVNANTATKSTDNAYSFGKWTFAVGVIKPDGSVALYSNGVNVTGTPGSAVLPPDTTGVMRIGARATGTDRNFDGVIDDVHIYNRALSASEVVALYKLGTATVNAANKTGLVGYWSFDNSDINGTTAYDRSGKGNNGTLTNGPTKVVGKLGQGLGFNGATNYVSLSSKPTGASGTITAWVYFTGDPTVDSTAREIISYGNDDNKLFGFSLRTRSSSFSGMRLDLTTANGTSIVGISGSTQIQPRKWYFVAVESSGIASSTRMFVNGVAESSYILWRPGTSDLGWWWDSAPTGTGSLTSIGAGKYVGSISSYFPGTIDDVRIYNRALSASEVFALYKLGTATIGYK